MSELKESESTPDLGPSTWSMDFPVYAKVGLWVVFGLWVIFSVGIISITLEGWDDAIRAPGVIAMFLYTIVLGLVGLIFTRSRSLIFRGDTLEYTTYLGRTRSMKLKEIEKLEYSTRMGRTHSMEEFEKAEEAIHSVLKVPVNLVIRAQHGQKCAVYSMLMGGADFQSFHEALKGRLHKVGVLERVKANT